MVATLSYFFLSLRMLLMLALYLQVTSLHNARTRRQACTILKKIIRALVIDAVDIF
jgi:hypothetical protein